MYDKGINRHDRVELHLGQILDRAWNSTNKNWGPMLLLAVVGYMVSQLPSKALMNPVTPSMTKYMAEGRMDKVIEAMYGPFDGTMIVKLCISLLLCVILNIFIVKVQWRLVWEGIHRRKYDATGLLKQSLKELPMFLAVSIVNNVVLVFSYLLLLVPGLILNVRLLLVPVIAANNPEMGISEVLGRSWDLTRGHWWTLLGYGIVAAGIVLVGFCCCCIGVIPAGIFCAFFLGETYKALCGGNDQSEETSQVDVESYEK